MSLHLLALVLTVDRVEGDVAVVEVPGGFVDLPLSLLPPGVGEGDRVRLRATTLAFPELRPRGPWSHGAAGPKDRSKDAGGLPPALEKP